MPPTDAIPLLSASLIVKDEEAVLDRCLASLAGVVDEVVVLDTGSTDRTVEVARAHGARVIHGTWHDDFGRSRNESLGHCRGRWALVIDADEVLRVEDPAALRSLLRGSRLDAFQITVDSYADDAGTVGVSHQSIRLLHRRAVHYEGRLHEQVRSNRHPRPLRLDQTPLAALGHWGYVPRVVDERGKTDRNIRIARKAIADGVGLRAEVDLGRTLAAAGRVEQALPHFAAGREAPEGLVRRTALRQGIAALVALGRPAEALEWVAALRSASSQQASVDLVEARVRRALDDVEGAIALYEANVHHEVVPDDDGVGETGSAVRTALGVALLDAGREAAGMAHLLAVAGTGPVRIWPRLVEALHAAGRIDQAAAVLDLADGDRARLVLAELVAAPVHGVGAFVDALDVANPGHPMVLAVAPLLAEHLDVEQAVTWAGRVRAAGLVGHCPLHRRARAEALDPVDRLESAGLLVELFGDPRGADLVRGLAATMPPDRFVDGLARLDELAPSSLEPFVVAATTDTGRCVAMAEALDHHGERAVALDVLRFGLDVAGAPTDRDRAVELVTAWAG